jgi:hypothetical protein
MEKGFAVRAGKKPSAFMDLELAICCTTATTMGISAREL